MAYAGACESLATIVLWSFVTEAVFAWLRLDDVPAPTSGVDSIYFSRDGSVLAVAARLGSKSDPTGGTIRLYRAPTATVPQRGGSAGADSPVVGCKPSERVPPETNAPIAIVAAELLQAFDGHCDVISCVRLSPDGSAVVGWAGDHVSLWQTT
jgi:WD40 repeat protein